MRNDCTYILKGTVYSESELNRLLLKLISENGVSFEKLKDYYVKSENFQEATKKKLQDLQNAIGPKETFTIIRDTSGDPEDPEVISKIPNSVGVTKSIHTAGFDKNIESPITPPFVPENFKLHRSEQYGNIENKETLINNEVKSWSFYGPFGEAIHKIFEQTGKGEEITKPKELSDFLFEKIKSEAKEFFETLKATHPNAEFYFEFEIKSKDLTPEFKSALVKRTGQKVDSVNGRIDLLVVDANGDAYIYDYKVSRRNVGDWNATSNFNPSSVSNEDLYASLEDQTMHTTKKRDIKYQMAMYSAILKQYGVNVAGCRIVPIKLDMNISKEFVIDEDAPVRDIKITHRKGHPWNNVPETVSGDIFNYVSSKLIPSNQTVVFESLDESIDLYNSLFSSHKISKEQENNRYKVDRLLSDPKFKQLVEPTSEDYKEGYRYYFYKNNTSKVGEKRVLCKTEQEFLEKVNDYVSEMNILAANEFDKLGAVIDEVLHDDTSVYTDIGRDFGPVKAEVISQKFKHFIKNKWTFVRNKELNGAGFFLFQSRDGLRSELVILTNDFLDTPQTLLLGHSILGDFVKDRNWNQKRIMAANAGNLKAFEALCWIAKNPNILGNTKISGISVLHPGSGREITPTNKQLLDNWEQLLMRKKDINVSLNPGLFMSDTTAAVLNAEERLLLHDAQNVDFKLRADANEVEFTAEWLREKIKGLFDAYPELMEKTGSFTKSKKNVNQKTQSRDLNDPLIATYHYLASALNSLESGFTYIDERDPGNYNVGVNPLGLYTTSMQYSPSVNIRQVGDIFNDYRAAIGRYTSARLVPLQKKFEAFYNSMGRIRAVGGEADYFMAFFRKDANGKLDSRFRVYDPDDSNLNTTKEGRDLLREILNVYNDLRFKGNTLKIQAAKEDGTYYEIPLLEAKFSRQVKGVGLKQTIKNKWKEVTNLYEGVIAGDEEEKLLFESKNPHEVYNRFDLTEYARQRKIDESTLGGIEAFETDLERVINEVVVAYAKQDVSKIFMPQFQLIDMELQYAQETKGAKVENIRKAFNKMVQKKVLGNPIMEEHLQPLYKFLAGIKSIFAKMSLGLNSKSFVRELLQGTYLGLNRAGVKMIEGVTLESYTNAFLHVLHDVPKNYGSVSLLQQLNAAYSMVNYSVSEIAGKMRNNTLGIRNWSEETLFLTSSSPDFQHRMAMLVAKMMGDGCFDAYSLDENGILKYDPEKDKRFEIFFSGDKSHKDYNSQKALYEANLNEWNRILKLEPGFTPLKMNNENGKPDKIPHAYTPREAANIRNFAEISYGHYDEESKAIINDMFIGAFFMQYKTFMVGRFEQWFLKPGTYNREKLKQQYDSETGEELYIVTTFPNEDGTGYPIRKLKTKSQVTQEEWDSGNVQNFIDWEGEPMEGVFYTMWSGINAIRHLSMDELKEIWNDPVKKANLGIFVHDMIVMMILGLIIKALFGEDTIKDIKNQNWITQWSYAVALGSTEDGNIFNIVDAMFGDLNPPMVTSLKRLANTTAGVITGDDTLGEFFTSNIGATRELSYLFESR